jgi:hypothetical protein
MGEQRMGDWKFVCAYSGFVGWASESALTWQGHRVLKRFLGQEAQRHPQEAPGPVITDEGRVPWAQPEGTFTFRSSTAVTPADL